MRKIPTLFSRDPEDLRHLTREVNPACQWVFDGEGTPTRKYDGTCVMYDGEVWWARREVKPGKQPPPGYRPAQTDPVTGKTMGWEPMAQSSYAKYHAEALEAEYSPVDEGAAWGVPQIGATYELVGPKINGNPENLKEHLLIRHGYKAAVDWFALQSLVLDYDSLADWLAAHPTWEGIVWHHRDGRMAKIKGRDFQ